MTNTNIKNILFVQDSAPCIRTIKLATALKSIGIKIFMAYKNKTASQVYGYGDEAFEAYILLTDSKRKNVKLINNKVDELNIDLIHFHNYPDKLGAKIIQSKPKVPFVYDQHDFMSQKRKNYLLMKHWERICNEKCDAGIYITENYRKLVAQNYNVNSNNIVFGNYGLTSLLYTPEEVKDYSINKKDTLDIVYIGLISEHENVRNMIEPFKKIAKDNVHIHIYPTRNKDYPGHTSIPNVHLHKQMTISELVPELNKYDFGIAFLNHFINSKTRATEVKYGFWNKMNDYLMADLPILTMKYYDDMSDFTLENKFGVSVENFEDISYENLKDTDVNKIRKNILNNRQQWTMESQVKVIIDLYEKTIKKFHAKA